MQAHYNWSFNSSWAQNHDFSFSPSWTPSSTPVAGLQVHEILAAASRTRRPRPAASNSSTSGCQRHASMGRRIVDMTDDMTDDTTVTSGPIWVLKLYILEYCRILQFTVVVFAMVFCCCLLANVNATCRISGMQINHTRQITTANDGTVGRRPISQSTWAPACRASQTDRRRLDLGCRRPAGLSAAIWFSWGLPFRSALLPIQLSGCQSNYGYLKGLQLC